MFCDDVFALHTFFAVIPSAPAPASAATLFGSAITGSLSWPKSSFDVLAIQYLFNSTEKGRAATEFRDVDNAKPFVACRRHREFRTRRTARVSFLLFQRSSFHHGTLLSNTHPNYPINSFVVVVSGFLLLSFRSYSIIFFPPLSAIQVIQPAGFSWPSSPSFQFISKISTHHYETSFPVGFPFGGLVHYCRLGLGFVQISSSDLYTASNTH